MHILANTTLGEVGHALLILFGLVTCFFGWQFFRWSLIAYSFIAGAILGLLLADLFFGWQFFILLIAGLTGGLMISFLAYKIFKLALFFNGFALGLLLALPLSQQLIPEYAYSTAIGFSILLGLIFISSHKSIMILSLSLIGSFLTIYGFCFFRRSHLPK